MAEPERHPGLCARCRQGRRIAGARSTFWLCERYRTDPAYPRYPRLPVLRCAGFDDREGHVSTDGPPEAPDRGHLSTDG